MSTHIGAKKGEIAPTVWLPGDPLRAERIAGKYLHNVTQYNKVRNMFGYTGMTPGGQPVSVQGGGMGMPSTGIYVHELVHDFDVKRIIRLGSAGGLQKDMHTGDIVIAQCASSDAGTNTRRFRGMQFAAPADPTLLMEAWVAAVEKLEIPVRVGGVISSEMFYNDVTPDEWKLWASYGVLAIEMETSELYTQGAKMEKGFQALTILTVSDVLPTGEELSALEREQTFDNMVRIALELA